jgi:phosphate transport system substrate-binding protein
MGGRIKLYSLTFALAFLLASLLLLLSSSLRAGEVINGAGATFPYPIYAKWAYEYEKATGNKVNYQSIGSGGGIRQITERTVDFGASDMPLKPEELENKKLLQFPTVIGGVVLAYNIPELRGQHIVLDGQTICHIYLGKIKTWDDPAIKALNPKANLPSKPITPVFRSDGSGTTAIFTHYLTQVCSEWAKEVGYGTSVNFRVGLSGKGNEGVANYVKRTPYAIGYVEYAYALQNKLDFAHIKNRAGNVVKPDDTTFKEAAATADLDPKKHFYTWLTDAPGKNAYPITGATFILLAKDRPEGSKKAVKFFDWAFQHGDQMALDLEYVPLPQSVKDKIRAYWKAHGIY